MCLDDEILFEHLIQLNFMKIARTDQARQLFNASAVIESRASTRLGENVKLLTFVSIFFLPLSFCTVCHINLEAAMTFYTVQLPNMAEGSAR